MDGEFNREQPVVDDSKKEKLYPDEWCFTESVFDGVQTTAIRCFEHPDYENFPRSLLEDNLLFRRLLLSLRDFAQARSALSFVQQEVDYSEKYPLAELRRFQAYETSLVISYCRPFSEAAGEVPRLSFKKLGVKLSPYTRAIHIDLINKRNKIFAHSDAEFVEFAEPIIMGMERPDGTRFSILYPPRFVEGLMFGWEELLRIENLVSCANQAVMDLLHAMHPNFRDHYKCWSEAP